MKRLKFAEHLTPLIIDGSKTSTWRLFDDKDLQVGDELLLVDQTGKEAFAQAKIVSVREKALGEVVESDFNGHEKFESCKKMIEAYRGYYGNSVTEDTPVKMVHFKIVTFL